MTTLQGMKRAEQAIEGATLIRLWGSIPCTGGSPWQNFNKKFPGHKEKMKGHLAQFNSLWDNFAKLAKNVYQKGGTISLEWPTQCAYWSYQKVNDLLKEIDMNKARMHGCELGLISEKEGRPILKQWTVATNDWYIYNNLSSRLSRKACRTRHLCRIRHQKNRRIYG